MCGGPSLDEQKSLRLCGITESSLRARVLAPRRQPEHQVTKAHKVDEGENLGSVFKPNARRRLNCTQIKEASAEC